MRRFSACWLALLVCVLPLPGKEKLHSGSYLDPASVHVETLLPAPPADDSATTKSEIQFLLQKQATRTPAEVARAQSEANPRPEIFADTVGPWFTEKNLPLTFALLKKVDHVGRKTADLGKDIWNRRRPWQQDPDIHPCATLPGNSSYPSGHATLGTLYALVLVQLAPDMKERLLARGRLMCEDRLIAGVHFPSDVAAGQNLGNVLFQRIAATPGYQADLARAKIEFQAARPKP